MKTGILILGNLIQKIALFKTGFNKGHELMEHIRMLDWVVSPYKTSRNIGAIISDEDYRLTPEEYFKKYPLENKEE